MGALDAARELARGASVVAAVVENRAKEVGVAVFDEEGGPSVDLEQNVETGSSFAATLCELQRARPDVILTLASASRGLNDALRRFAEAHSCALAEVPRRHFGPSPAPRDADTAVCRVFTPEPAPRASPPVRA